MENSYIIAQPLLQQLGPNMNINAPFPTKQIPNVDPFLLLHHFGPIDVQSRKDFLVPPHPHKGFEAITFLFSGSIEHNDSFGNSGLLQSGDIQWMTAGNGIEHQEGYPFEGVKQTIEGIQLWVNLPANEKQNKPRYQDIQSKDIPILLEGLNIIRVFAGNFEGKQAPTKTVTDITALHVKVENSIERSFQLNNNYNVVLYILHGNVSVEGIPDPIGGGAALILKNRTEPIVVSINEKSEFVLLGGIPINEPIASYGPFVMNYDEEIITAIKEYRSGAWGKV